MDCSTPGFPVLHYLLGFPQTHVHWVGDAIRPSHPLLKGKQQFHSCLTWDGKHVCIFKSSQLEGSYAGEVLGPILVLRSLSYKKGLVRPAEIKPNHSSVICFIYPFHCSLSPPDFHSRELHMYVPVTGSGERTPWEGQPSTYLETCRIINWHIRVMCYMPTHREPPRGDGSEVASSICLVSLSSSAWPGSSGHIHVFP